MLGKLIQLFTPPLSAKDFTREVEYYVENLGLDLEPREVEPLHLEICRPGDEPIHVHLENAYRNYLANRGSRREIIAGFVNALLSTDDKLLPKDIVPVIKDRAFVTETLEYLKSQGKDTSDFFVVEDYNEELVIVYAVDSRQSLRYMNPSMLKELELHGESLRSLAVSNLKRILPEINARGQSPLWMLTAGGTFESSLLLLDNVWDKTRFRIEGEIVVAIPCRDVLLVTDSSSEVGLQGIRRAAAEARSAAYRLTDRLFIRRNSEFVPL